jgi:N-acetylglucosamine kinase-like BadF-type ATPase
MYLGVDGGGTKTAFAIVSEDGRVLAGTVAGSSYHPEVGLAAVRSVIEEGIRAVLAAAGVERGALRHAFFGLPTFGEDKHGDEVLANMPSGVLARDRYTVGNDMICSWAGALACADGISVIAGTGSIAYGEFAGRQARSGGWGEIFGDEGSAYWIAREGLTLFARMSDGRTQRGPLHALVREHYGLDEDIDLAGKINGMTAAERSSMARLSRLVADAADAGDDEARAIYARAARELAEIVVATRGLLGVPADVTLPVSYTGGVFQTRDLVLAPFAAALAGAGRFDLQAPKLEPVIGAALYAARRAGPGLSAEAIARLLAA